MEQALCDHLVCGLKSDNTQKKLLTEADLTFTRAVEIAEGMEAAEASTQQISKGGAAAINKINPPKVNLCYRGGRNNHTADEWILHARTFGQCVSIKEAASSRQTTRPG